MKKKYFIIFLLISVLYLIYSIFVVSNERETIKIGFIGTLSGSSSNFGVSGRNGAVLALSELNHSDYFKNRTLELVVKDDFGSKEDGLKALSELDSESVDIVIANMTSSNIKPLIPYANKNGMLIISPSVSSDDYTALDDNFIRLTATSRLFGSSLAKSVSEMGNKSAVVIQDVSNLSFTSPLVESFIDEFNALGGEISSIYTVDSDENFNPDDAISYAIESGSDSIVMSMNDIKSARFFQSMSKYELDTDIFSTTWSLTNELIASSGRSLDGTYFVDMIDFSNTTTVDSILEFKKKYRDFFNEEAAIHSLRAYDSMKFIAASIKIADSENPEKLKPYMTEISFEGKQGNIYIDKFGDLYKEHVLFKIENGKLKTVQTK